MFKHSWVYILRCCDGSYYTGCTTALEKRIKEHELGIFPGYTSSRRPVRLVWSAEFPDIFQAIAVERQIKGWSRKKKEALIQQEFDLLHQLSQSTEMKLRKERRDRTAGYRESRQMTVFDFAHLKRSLRSD
jgi:predicted GIY-YIG superfamily endonuclease